MGTDAYCCQGPRDESLAAHRLIDNNRTTLSSDISDTLPTSNTVQGIHSYHLVIPLLRCYLTRLLLMTHLPMMLSASIPGFLVIHENTQQFSERRPFHLAIKIYACICKRP